MSVAERYNEDSLSSDDLKFAMDQIQAGNFPTALQAIGRAKVLDPRNIFLIALEKQVMRLKAGGILPKERAEVIDSLPGLVDRARAARKSEPPSTPSPHQNTGTSPSGKDPRLTSIVDGYFKHAEEWIRRGDFEAALKEIERVLLIEPDNKLAKEYQTRVQQLFTGDAKPVAQSEHLIPLSVAEPEPEPEKTKRKPMPVLIGAAVLLVVVVVAGVMAFRPRPSQYRPGFMYVMQVPPASADNSESLPPPVVQEALPATSVAKPEPEEPAITPPVVNPPASKQQPEDRSKKEPEQIVTPAEPEPVPVEPPKQQPVQDMPTALAPSSAPAKGAEEAESQPTSAFIPVQQEPKIIRLQQPSFTEEDHNAGIAGEIVLKVQIDKTGKPLQTKIISSTNSRLNQPVADAVMRSTFAPGVMSSGPVTTWMTIPLKLK